MDGRWEEIHRRSLDCVHCGLCLSACPTYRATGREQSSPRGRVYLFRGVAEGRIPLAGVVAEEAHLCLGCRGCETACPSGVSYGPMLEAVRAEVEEAGLRGGLAARVERFALRSILPRPRRLRLALDALALAQTLGLDRLAARLLPGAAGALAGQAPRVPARSERARLPERIPAEGERRGRVGLFVGCVMPELFGDVNAATARVLARNGFEVVVVPGQGCCGALHAHSGDERFARELARTNAAAFRSAGVERVVVNSAGCGAAMLEAGDWLGAEGAELARTVVDPCVLLDEMGLRAPTVRREMRLCYDDPCHLVHGQKVHDAPRRLLQALPGVELSAHREPTACCGAAGIYNLTHRAMSQQVLARKIDALAAADPDAIVSGNPGCLMQLARGAADRGLRARVLHPMVLLDEAYRAETSDSSRPSRRIL
jgi:glycolate oxidase iron-sulfur subunit